jgi:hypothetical protein
MSSFACTDDLILRGLASASGVSRRRADHALDVLKYRLDSPEATTCQNGSLLALIRGQRRIQCRVRYRNTGTVFSAGNCADEYNCQEKPTTQS